MGSYRSKEDDVSRTSTLIFVTNFPDSFSGKDLFHSCKQYGHVVDTFIPSKRSKAGKRFGFVRFINVFNVERLEKKDVRINRSGTNVPSKDVGVTGTGKSYVHMVKGNNIFGTMECDSISAIVLDDECLYSKYLSKSLLGRVKEFSFLSNLKTALMNEGFVDIKIQYIGELWGELLDVDDQEEMCFHSKRLCLYTKSGMNIFENFKVIFRGKVFWICAKEVPGWVPDFLDDSDDEDQSDDGFKDGDHKVQGVGSCGDDSFVAEVPKTLFEESTGQKEKQSEDPFGFTPNDDMNEFCMNDENVRSVNDDNPQNCNVDEIQTGQEGNSANKGSKVDVSESVCLGHFKKSKALRTGGSILCLLEELVNVRQTMGYNMDGCVNNMTEIIESQGAFGSVFNVQGADVFNSFIANAGLEEVPLAENTWSDAPGDDSNAMRKELEVLDAAIDKGNGSDEIINKRMEVINSMHHIDKIQAMDMAQKAKIKWSIEGDKNSRFFHGVLNKKRSQLNIRGIMVDGVWTEKPNTVKHEFLQHFQRIIDKPTVSRAYVNMSYPKSITIDQQMDLERDVSKEELKRGVGLWNGQVPWSGWVPVWFLSPISLIGSIYKIIAKILANRIVGVLGDIVNEVQSAFIAERQILDGPFILNEVLQWCKLKKKQSLIFSVDFEKAYDSVRWDFLDDVLKKFGFGNK
nr:RNA-directed DNA polymerase, eukaryota [Tanacetum cinerariifolium]